MEPTSKIQKCVICVDGLPEKTSDEELQRAAEQVGHVDAAYVEVDYNLRCVRDYGFIVIRREHADSFISSDIVLRDSHIRFVSLVYFVEDILHKKATKRIHNPPVADWPHDVRPGHPDYVLPQLSEEPFDLDKPDQDLASAHDLNEDVLRMIFKMLNARQLLRIERTCRRWQYLVRDILGGQKVVNMADKKSTWGKTDFRTIAAPYFGTSLVQKICILNADTLQHLIVYNLKVDDENTRRSAKQCCPNLTHFTIVYREPYSRYINSTIYFQHTDQTKPLDIVYNSIDDEESLPVQEVHHHHLFRDVPSCVCTSYIESLFREIDVINSIGVSIVSKIDKMGRRNEIIRIYKNIND